MIKQYRDEMFRNSKLKAKWQMSRIKIRLTCVFLLRTNYRMTFAFESAIKQRFYMLKRIQANRVSKSVINVAYCVVKPACPDMLREYKDMLEKSSMIDESRRIIESKLDYDTRIPARIFN